LCESSNWATIAPGGSMNLKNRKVLVTGASGGIGLACANRFAEAGADLAICARNTGDLEAAADAIRKEYRAQVLTFTVDVRERSQVEQMARQLSGEWKYVDILVNNAGLALGLEKVQEGLVEDWETMIDTNVKGLLYVTRAVVPLMVESGKPCHVINIGSLAGIQAYPGGAVYCGTKSAVRAISDGLRMDVADRPIRVTNIQPGLVETNFSVVRFHGDRTRAENVYKGIKPLTADDIADIVLYAASAPDHVQICEVTVTATHQASAQVVYKRN
jgi:3-hydroxy acid dehydrogenase / malonic semialdehyde reductase